DDLLIGVGPQLSVLRLVDGAVATIAGDLVVGAGGAGAGDVIASSLSVGGVLEIGVEGDGWLELIDGGVALAGSGVVIGPLGGIGGDGELIGAVSNAGVLVPRALLVAGPYVQTGELELAMDASAAGAPLIVEGTARLGGTLRVVAGPDDIPQAGDIATVLWAERIDGRFARLAAPATPGRRFTLTNAGHEIVLRVEPAAQSSDR
ncbi:MAG: hypothetical protein ACYTJ0_14300, partial [Planctomycetota bacterium]